MITIVRRFFAIIILWGLLTSISTANVLTARVDRNNIAFGETFQLIITLHGKAHGQPDILPLEKHFQVFGTAKNTEFKNINGKSSTKTTWDIILSARHTGKITIPAIRLGKLTTQPITIEVKKMTPQAASRSVSAGEKQDIYLDVKVTPTAPFQQSQVMYTVQIYFDVNIAQPTLTPPKVANALIKRLGRDIMYQTTRHQQLYQVVERRYVIFPQDAGKVTIHPPTFSGYIDTNSRSPIDQIFGVGARKPIHIKAKTLKLHVQRKPANVPYSQWLPAQRVVIQDGWSVSPNRLRVNEPVTRTIIISGVGVTAGQLPSVAKQTLSEFKTYPDKPYLQNNAGPQGVIGTRTERIALIPEKAGKFTLPAVKVHWWDPQTRKPHVASLPAKTVTILPALASSGAKRLAPAAPKIKPSPSLPTALKLTGPTQQTNQGPHEIIHNRWLWLAVILLILWLATLFFWWRQREPKLAKIQHQPAKTFLTAIKKASLANDKHALRKALLAWAQANWPQASIRNLGDISQQLDNPELTALLTELDEALYKDPHKVWSGKNFWQTLRSNLAKSNSHKSAKQNNDTLPPLHLD